MVRNGKNKHLIYVAGFKIPKKAKKAIRRIQIRGISMPAIAIPLPERFSFLIFLSETIPKIIAKIPSSIPRPNNEMVKTETIPRTNAVIADFDVSTIKLY